MGSNTVKVTLSSPELASFRNATAWINTEPLSPSALSGKVVLVQFWTFTCINWLRTLPYTRAWAHKYSGRGLVVIGVHAPEFVFERDLENVRRQVKALNVDYAVALDNDYAIWRAFGNQYWPALYLIDAHGRNRYHQFGEGEYDRSERTIQRLLSDSGAKAIDDRVVAVSPEGVEAAADWGDLRSPENYVGYERTAKFASPGGIVEDREHVYAAPAALSLNQWALIGRWTISKGAVSLAEPNGAILNAFHARDVHLVMGPSRRGSVVRFRVLLDGKPPGPAHGADVNEEGNGTASEQRLYQLLRQPGPISDRRVEIQFLDAGVEAFAFTFG